MAAHKDKVPRRCMYLHAHDHPWPDRENVTRVEETPDPPPDHDTHDTHESDDPRPTNS